MQAIQHVNQSSTLLLVTQTGLLIVAYAVRPHYAILYGFVDSAWDTAGDLHRFGFFGQLIANHHESVELMPRDLISRYQLPCISSSCSCAPIILSKVTWNDGVLTTNDLLVNYPDLTLKYQGGTALA
ncbi:hypothetical protein KIN20_001512 [Parelaphostrongylus tenuis]|uniref:Uncharacterized protein n=1 Tax=Parelaphostrongylus tenuis TaxID=148309 RepID=A0AAD5MCW9_PARTN|nr:hypothetical protein KIN20_001512 [Parelaphostrongylus tenuis]